MSSIWRKPHVIKREHTVRVPRHLVFYDTETRMVRSADGSVQHTLRLGWCCYWRRATDRHKDREEWFEFRDVQSFWCWLLSHTEAKVKLWVIARNLAFDFSVCDGWRYLRSEGYHVTFFYGKGCVTIICVRCGNKSIVFLDSLNWFRESLKSTGERIGIPKMEVDFDTVCDEELSVYCRNDVLIEKVNFQHFISFLIDKRISRVCYTRGSCAMAAYLLRHYHTPIYIHNNAEAIRLERASYRGGRVECFYIGTLSAGPYYVLDINSLYPSVMAVNDYPVKYVTLTHALSVSSLRSALSDYSVVARVQLDTDEPVYGIRSDRTIFPIGRFWSVLCSPELEYAFEHNHVVGVADAVLYDKANIFGSFVADIYGMRLQFKREGNTEYQEFCKYLLNSLYGKFGQKAETWEKIGDCPGEPDRVEVLIDLPTRTCRKLRYLMGVCEVMTRHGESFDSFPAIASHVTAYGRMALWRLIQIAGSGHYFYCDTDSLIVDSVGLERLTSELSTTRLGGLKVESTTDTVTLNGVKDYVIDSKTVIKGIRKNARQLENGVYEQECWPSLGGLLHAGSQEPYTVKMVTKHLVRDYSKGTVQPNGVVVPYVLTDLP